MENAALSIRPLSPALLGDYLAFFDDTAFSDHPEWSFCYCTFFHLGRQDEKKLEAECGGRWSKSVLRGVAVDLIRQGKLKGYLAYLDGRVVGWCNANGKGAFQKLLESTGLCWDGAPAGGKSEGWIKAVTCFIVAPQYRRRGVASALLSRVIQDAAAEGCAALEAYPATGERTCYEHYHGHPAMYEAHGFTLRKSFEDYCVYQKTLRNGE